MTREEAKTMLPIIQAFAEGRVIECRTKPSSLKGSDTPNGWTEMKEIEFWNNTEYRVKPEPTYRPFKNGEECWKEMQKHQPFGWVKEKGDKLSYELLACVSENDEAPISFAVYGSVGMGIIDRPSIKFNEMFNAFTFADSAPFGVKEGVWEN